MTRRTTAAVCSRLGGSLSQSIQRWGVFAALAFAPSLSVAVTVDPPIFLGDQGGFRIDYVVGQGDWVPGLDAPIDYIDYGQSNNAGDAVVRFFAGEQSGVLSARYRGQVTPFMVSGQPAPNADGMVLGEIAAVGIADSGDILAYWSVLVAPSSTTSVGFGEAVYLGAGDSPDILVHNGSPAPGGDGRVFDHFGAQYPAIHRNGVVSLFAFATNGPPGYWTYEPGVGIREAVGGGQELAPGTEIDEFPFAKVDESGRTTFVAQLTGDNYPRRYGYGLWTEDPDGGFHPVALSGAHAPGLPERVTYQYGVDVFLPNSSGEIVFSAQFTGLGVESPIDRGIWIERPNGVVELLLLEGQEVPSDPDSVFTAVAPASFNNTGTTLGTAQIRSKTDGSLSSILWSLSPEGEFSTLAESGDPAPGVSDLAEFLGFSGQAYINEAGEVAFIATLTDGREGLWVIDALGAMHTILREGDRLESPDGSTRTVAVFGVGGEINPGLTRSPFTNSGRLPIQLRFTDNADALYMMSLGRVPEPTAVAGAVALLIGAALRRRGQI